MTACLLLYSMYIHVYDDGPAFPTGLLNYERNKLSLETRNGTRY